MITVLEPAQIHVSMVIELLHALMAYACAHLGQATANCHGSSVTLNATYCALSGFSMIRQVLSAMPVVKTWYASVSPVKDFENGAYRLSPIASACTK